ncbi:MAG: YbhB/YbcL family Raf kinase inhibitor-like protein [Pseudomonadota bacterium]
MSLFLLALIACHDPADTQAPTDPHTPGALALTSSAFSDGTSIPEAYSCDGDAGSPPLAWQGAPEGTAAFALTLRDPDAPSGDCHHWGLVDLPATVDHLDEGASPGGSLPEGAWEALSYLGTAGYAGPCPPPGAAAHTYRFTLYALNAPLGDPGEAPALADVLADLDAATLGTATLVGSYGR